MRETRTHSSPDSILSRPTVPNTRAGNLEGHGICGEGNSALFGQCLASSGKSLRIFGLPGPGESLYPGLQFQLSVAMDDAYNQTVTSDFSSLIQLQVALTAGGQQADPSIAVSGDALFRLHAGQAMVMISIQPPFTEEDVTGGHKQWRLAREVLLFASAEGKLSTGRLLSPVAFVDFAAGNAICPPGYILNLDSLEDHDSAAGAKGRCAYCQPGTYSLNPLASGSANQTRPACLKCLPASTCSGGDNVQLGTGEWFVEETGIYRLVRCPAGHQLIDSINGAFSHDLQVCTAGA